MDHDELLQELQVCKDTVAAQRLELEALRGSFQKVDAKLVYIQSLRAQLLLFTAGQCREVADRIDHDELDKARRLALQCAEHLEDWASRDE